MRPVLLQVGLGDRLVDYQQGWQLQRQLHAEVVQGVRPPTIVLLEHEHVYTAGTRTQPADRPPPGEPVVDVDRGGRITWHGPGQVVAYPIVALPHPLDVVAYVRRLEDALIDTCGHWGVTGERVAGRSGVWVRGGDRGDRKIAAIGVRVASGVTMHGVALNVTNDLSLFARIVPCGISDATVTSLQAEGADLPGDAPMVEVADVLGRNLGEALDWD